MISSTIRPSEAPSETSGRRWWSRLASTLGTARFLLDEHASLEIESFLNQARMILVGCVFLLAITGALPGATGDIVPVIAAAGLVWVALTTLLIHRGYRPWIAIVIAILDTLFIAGLIFLTGGPHSALDALYAVVIFAASIRFSRTHSILLTAAVITAYVAVTRLHPTFGELIDGDVIITRSVILAATGVLAWLISAEVSRQRRAIVEARERLQSLTAIAHVSRVLHLTHHSDEIVRSAVSLVRQLIGPASVHVAMYDRDRCLRLAVVPGHDGDAGGGHQDGNDGVAPIRWNPASTPAEIVEAMKRQGSDRVDIVPVGDPIWSLGLLLIGTTEQSPLTAADRAMAERIASEIATSLQRTRLLDLERERARMLTQLADENGRLLQRERETVARLRQLATHKDSFIAMVAHELRTPLTSIKGYSQMLLRSDAQAQIKRIYADTILAQSNRMVNIIDEIVDLSRMERGLLEMRQETVDLCSVLQEVAALRDAIGYNVSLECAADLPPVVGDRDKLRQTFVNLVQSGSKYHCGPGPLRLRAEADADGVLVSLEVQGSIPEQRLAHIFDQVPPKAETSGSGLTLYICKNYIEAHGGRLWVERSDDAGRFILRLPHRERRRPVRTSELRASA